MRRKIVSGGQTGADRGGLDAARKLGIPHGGWCPKGRRAEDGAIPAGYRLKETRTSRYAERTERNVRFSDGTVVFTRGRPMGGSALTVRLARQHRKPLLRIDLKKHTDREAAAKLREWMTEHAVAVVNVAGSRESRAPGIGRRVLRIVQTAMRATSPGSGPTPRSPSRR